MLLQYNFNMLERLQKLKKLYDEISPEPGIYQYFDSENNLLYVGKAKNLKKRIKSYFTKDFLPNPRNSSRIQKMTSLISNITTLIVENEKEALILENSFIKSQNPKYNILLRDDKTYPYIYINLNEKYPRFETTRNIRSINNPNNRPESKITKSQNILIFGPYTNGVKNIIDSIYETFPLVQQKSCLRNKTVCLYFQMKKCLGVCQYDKKDEYDIVVDNALSCLKNPTKFIKILESKMLHFAKYENFEEAKKCRDTINILKNQNISIVDTKKTFDIDILCFYGENQRAIFFKLFVRDGKVISSDHIFLRAAQESEVEVYTQSLLKLEREGVYNQILIANISSENFKILNQNLASLNLNLINAKIGDKKSLATLALKNAKYLLNQKLDSNEYDILSRLKELFLLDREIERIEVFDTSHHAGSYASGGMVVYENNAFIKEAYRHYKLEGSDEISQMRELLTRRAKSFIKTPPPSLWLLDGGAAQINIALDVLKSVGVSVEILAISKEKRDAKAHRVANRAKGRAQDILRSKDLEYKLETSDKRLQLMQKLRDEAHRFAISFHRLRKNKVE